MNENTSDSKAFHFNVCVNPENDFLFISSAVKIFTLCLKYFRSVLQRSCFIILFAFTNFLQLIPNAINYQSFNFTTSKQHKLICLISCLVTIPKLPNHWIWNIYVVTTILFTYKNIQKSSSFIIMFIITMGVIIWIILLEVGFILWWYCRSPYCRYVQILKSVCFVSMEKKRDGGVSE